MKIDFIFSIRVLVGFCIGKMNLDNVGKLCEYASKRTLISQKRHWMQDPNSAHDWVIAEGEPYIFEIKEFFDGNKLVAIPAWCSSGCQSKFQYYLKKPSQSPRFTKFDYQSPPLEYKQELKNIQFGSQEKHQHSEVQLFEDEVKTKLLQKWLTPNYIDFLHQKYNQDNVVSDLYRIDGSIVKDIKGEEEVKLYTDGNKMDFNTIIKKDGVFWIKHGDLLQMHGPQTLTGKSISNYECDCFIYQDEYICVKRLKFDLKDCKNRGPVKLVEIFFQERENITKQEFLITSNEQEQKMREEQKKPWIIESITVNNKKLNQEEIAEFSSQHPAILQMSTQKQVKLNKNYLVQHNNLSKHKIPEIRIKEVNDSELERVLSQYQPKSFDSKRYKIIFLHTEKHICLCILYPSIEQDNQQETKMIMLDQGGFYKAYEQCEPSTKQKICYINNYVDPSYTILHGNCKPTSIMIAKYIKSNSLKFNEIFQSQEELKTEVVKQKIKLFLGPVLKITRNKQNPIRCYGGVSNFIQNRNESKRVQIQETQDLSNNLQQSESPKPEEKKVEFEIIQQSNKQNQEEKKKNPLASAVQTIPEEDKQENKKVFTQIKIKIPEKSNKVMLKPISNQVIQSVQIIPEENKISIKPNKVILKPISCFNKQRQSIKRLNQASTIQPKLIKLVPPQTNTFKAKQMPNFKIKDTYTKAQEYTTSEHLKKKKESINVRTKYNPKTKLESLKG